MRGTRLPPHCAALASHPPLFFGPFYPVRWPLAIQSPFTPSWVPRLRFLTRAITPPFIPPLLCFFIHSLEIVGFDFAIVKFEFGFFAKKPKARKREIYCLFVSSWFIQLVSFWNFVSTLCNFNIATRAMWFYCISKEKFFVFFFFSWKLVVVECVYAHNGLNRVQPWSRRARNFPRGSRLLPPSTGSILIPIIIYSSDYARYEFIRRWSIFRTPGSQTISI